MLSYCLRPYTDNRVMVALSPLMAYRAIVFQLCLLVALQLRHGVGVAVVNRSVAGLPQLTVRAATHFQLGLQTGLHFKDEIQSAIRESTFFMERVLPFNVTSEGGALYSKYHDTAKSSFPQYLEEIRGMAEGVNLSYSELFLWNMQFEYHLLLEPVIDHLPPPSCSDFYLVVSENKIAIMGHNEDGIIPANKTSYIIDAEVIYDNRDGESFVAFCYAGQLCSTTFGYSETASKVFTSDALFPKNVNTNAVGRNFLHRGLLVTKFEDIPHFLSQFPCSSGFTYNAGSLNNHKVTNFEVSPSGVVATEIKGFDYHFNMYIHSNVAEYEDPGSVHHLTRVKQLPQPTNSSGILDLLGDTNDPDYPIYRNGASPDTLATLATALFDLEKGMFYIYRGNPAMAKQPVIAIQMKKDECMAIDKSNNTYCKRDSHSTYSESPLE